MATNIFQEFVLYFMFTILSYKIFHSSSRCIHAYIAPVFSTTEMRLDLNEHALFAAGPFETMTGSSYAARALRYHGVANYCLDARLVEDGDDIFLRVWQPTGDDNDIAYRLRKNTYSWGAKNFPLQVCTSVFLFDYY